MTATALAMLTTLRTPSRFTGASTNEATLPPITGHCAERRVEHAGCDASIPKMVLPRALSATVQAGSSLPRSLELVGRLQTTSFGTGCFGRIRRRSSHIRDARLEPATSSRSRRARRQRGTFHFAAAAPASFTRAPAPACRKRVPHHRGGMWLPAGESGPPRSLLM
jgi:hypothetical protein